ncbi:hypothetical protein [Halocynthiibacter sp.]|uniref:hypothetical protein n=1 Tax=Halocynthiibacter sp. TaxID=1979210 RepID=UPI003C69B80E
MSSKLKNIVALGVAGLVLLGCKSEQTADLGQVLDRTEFALMNYQGYLEENNFDSISEDQMGEFTGYYTSVLNAEPRFYAKNLGLTIQADAMFLGFADANGNGIQDDGEGKVFTVEIDEANNRLIATDVAGNSSGLRFSGTGFLTGMLLGNLLGRQRGAGIAANSFNNRNVTPRGQYQAPRSARSGGPRAGK